jgi:hypothetical protein
MYIHVVSFIKVFSSRCFNIDFRYKTIRDNILISDLFIKILECRYYDVAFIY